VRWMDADALQLRNLATSGASSSHAEPRATYACRRRAQRVGDRSGPSLRSMPSLSRRGGSKVPKTQRTKRGGISITDEMIDGMADDAPGG
jgi:hypothetical protein